MIRLCLPSLSPEKHVVVNEVVRVVTVERVEDEAQKVMSGKLGSIKVENEVEYQQ